MNSKQNNTDNNLIKDNRNVRQANPSGNPNVRQANPNGNPNARQVNPNSNTKKSKTKKKKISPEEKARKALKHSSSFFFNMLVNVVIVYFVVKIFAFSFDFTYSVFGDVALDPGQTKYEVVEIPADSSIMKIGETLEEQNIIESKYVFFVKVKVKGCGDKIKAGKYGLSSCMSCGEILEVICGLEEEEDE